TGLSDINLSLFFSPANSGSVIWGIGPVLSFPTATDDALASKKWSAGPSVIILTQPEGWTLGLVAQNTWSYAGDETKTDVNFFYSQIFIVKNLPKGWYLNCAPIITANWKASSGNQWTVPLGIGAGKLLKFGKLPVNLQAGYYYNAVKPDGGAKWQLRGLMVFFLPNF
ncbi:MAG: neuromedin U, partial [Ignavibacteriae bacterium]|nr:neuromedin U [Ignavibacteriota bacterium]